MRERLADLTGDPDELARIAAAAGLRDVRVRRVEVLVLVLQGAAP